MKRTPEQSLEPSSQQRQRMDPLALCKLVFHVFAALAEYAERAVMRSDAIEVEVWPARWPLGAPHNIQRYGPQRFRDCGEVRSKDWTVWPEPGAQPVRAGLDLS
jgi:hypothetical protein